MEATAVEMAGVEVCEVSVPAVWGVEVARLAPLGAPQLMAHLLEAPPLGVQAPPLGAQAPQPQLAEQLAWICFCFPGVVHVPS